MDGQIRLILVLLCFSTARAYSERSALMKEPGWLRNCLVGLGLTRKTAGTKLFEPLEIPSGPIRVTEVAGAGDEAAMFRVPGHPDLLVRVDHFGFPPIKEKSRLAKAHLLNRVLPQNLVKPLAVAPVETKQGSTRGIVMQNLEEYPDIENVNFLTADAARNLPGQLEMVFTTLSRNEISASDYNFKNIKIDVGSGRVILIDLASVYSPQIPGDQPSWALKMEIDRSGRQAAIDLRNHAMYLGNIDGLIKKGLLPKDFSPVGFAEFQKRVRTPARNKERGAVGAPPSGEVRLGNLGV